MTENCTVHPFCIPGKSWESRVVVCMPAPMFIPSLHRTSYPHHPQPEQGSQVNAEQHSVQATLRKPLDGVGKIRSLTLGAHVNRKEGTAIQTTPYSRACAFKCTQAYTDIFAPIYQSKFIALSQSKGVTGNFLQESLSSQRADSPSNQIPDNKVITHIWIMFLSSCYLFFPKYALT